VSRLGVRETLCLLREVFVWVRFLPTYQAPNI
jgi:hypothetical protein